MASRSGSGLLGQPSPNEFPILCESCLGDNPLVRMQHIPASHSAACKICERPYHTYRWKAGVKGRYKKTEICITCAKLKNVCQTCILDLQYHLPVQVRDSVLSADQRIQLPNSTVQRNWMIEQFERQQQTVEHAGGDSNQSLYAPLESNQLLSKLNRSSPNYTRNDTKLCSYFARGECNRGAACPFKHELPSHDASLAKQNIKQRYQGVNDPVADKILNKHNDATSAAHSHNSNTPPAPADQSITTLFVGSIDDSITEQSLHDVFNAYGEIKSISILHDRGIAFVQYHTRTAANEAIDQLYDKLQVNGKSLKLDWTKAKRAAPQQQISQDTAQPLNTAAANGSAAKKQRNTGPPASVPHHTTGSVPLPPGIKL